MANDEKKIKALELGVQKELERKALLDAMEKEKKDQERLKALYYFTAAYIDKVEQKRIISQLRRIESFGFYNKMEKVSKQKLLSTCALGIKYAEIQRKLQENKKEFFMSAMDDKQAAEVRRTITEANFSEDHFATLAICASNKHMKKCCDAILEKPLKPEEEQNIKQIKKESVLSAVDAIVAFKGGNYKNVAHLIKQGLEFTCKGFAQARDEDEMLEYSNMTAEIMYVLEEYPMLIKASGLKPNQLEIAKKTAELGDELRRGLAAVQVLIAAEQKDVIELTEKQHEDMISMSLKTKKALAERQELAKTWEIEAPVLEMK